MVSAVSVNSSKEKGCSDIDLQIQTWHHFSCHISNKCINLTTLSILRLNNQHCLVSQNVFSNVLLHKCTETLLQRHAPAFYSSPASHSAHISLLCAFYQLQSPFHYLSAKVYFPLSLACGTVFGHRLPAFLGGLCPYKTSYYHGDSMTQSYWLYGVEGLKPMAHHNCLEKSSLERIYSLNQTGL